MLPNLSVIATMRVSRIDAESYFAFWCLPYVTDYHSYNKIVDFKYM